MSATVADIVRIMESIAPVQLSESWDNPGLQVGRTDWPVRKIVVALDPTTEVIRNAGDLSADMLVVHHPMLFRPLKSIDLATTIGSCIDMAIRNRIAVYSAHTNLDSAPDGLNDMLASEIDLSNLSSLTPPAAPIEMAAGLGRVGDLPRPTDLISLCRLLKKRLGLDTVRMLGDPARTVSRIALCTGSGASLLDRFFDSGAQVFVTGDIRYHEALDARERGAALIDIGHFGSEHIMVKALRNRLSEATAPRYPGVTVQACTIETDPMVVV